MGVAEVLRDLEAGCRHAKAEILWGLKRKGAEEKRTLHKAAASMEADGRWITEKEAIFAGKLKKAVGRGGR